MHRIRAGASPLGFSLVELLLVCGMIATLSIVTIPNVIAMVDSSRAAGAARYVSGRLYRARMEAVTRSSTVALRFVQTQQGYAFAVYVDGNGNGVRTIDIERGIDRELLPAERLPHGFSGVDFGVLPGLPPVDVGGSPVGPDPIKIGASNILSFTRFGTSTSGSLYILGRSGAQYVVRVFGDTGKLRVLKFDAGAKRWRPL